MVRVEDRAEDVQALEEMEGSKFVKNTLYPKNELELGELDKSIQIFHDLFEAYEAVR